MDGWETVCAVKFTCYTQSLPDILSSFFANFRSFVVHLLLFWQPFSLRNLIFFFFFSLLGNIMMCVMEKLVIRKDLLMGAVSSLSI